MFHRRLNWRLAVATLIALVYCGQNYAAAGDKPQTPQINVVEKTSEHPFEFEVTDLPASVLERLATLEPTDAVFPKLFSVTVVSDPPQPAIPPVAGKYRIDGQRLVFVPRFPPRPGLTYRAVLHAEAAAGKQLERDITIPNAEANQHPTEVQRIYPSLDVLPENLLRFYIHFSQPMARGAAYENLQLLDAQGKELEASFLELGEELWDPEFKRFTLLLDPGRIKRGLKPREDLGPILETGKEYTLVVKPSWLDAQGQRLKTEFRKSFKAGPEINTGIELDTWDIQNPHPTIGSREPFVLKFPRALDRALLERMLYVTFESTQQPVDGQVTVSNSEREWAFVPRKPWQAGRYRLVVDTDLEDPSGNRVGRQFEVDQQEVVTQKIVAETQFILFETVLSKPKAAKPKPMARGQ